MGFQVLMFMLMGILLSFSVCLSFFLSHHHYRRATPSPRALSDDDEDIEEIKKIFEVEFVGLLMEEGLGKGEGEFL